MQQPTPVFLPGEFLWTEEPGGLTVHGVTESATTERLRTAQHSLIFKIENQQRPTQGILLSFLQ